MLKFSFIISIFLFLRYIYLRFKTSGLIKKEFDYYQFLTENTLTYALLEVLAIIIQNTIKHNFFINIIYIVLIILPIFLIILDIRKELIFKNHHLNF